MDRHNPAIFSLLSRSLKITMANIADIKTTITLLIANIIELSAPGWANAFIRNSSE
jgi:hypothetical protein